MMLGDDGYTALTVWRNFELCQSSHVRWKITWKSCLMGSTWNIGVMFAFSVHEMLAHHTKPSTCKHIWTNALFSAVYDMCVELRPTLMHVLLEIVANFNAIESVQTCLNEIFYTGITVKMMMTMKKKMMTCSRSSKCLTLTSY